MGVVYLNDIIIFSTSFIEHVYFITNILKKLRESNKKIQGEKCHFAPCTTKFLGHVVSVDGIRPDSSKIQAVAAMSPPSKFTNFRHRKFT